MACEHCHVFLSERLVFPLNDLKHFLKQYGILLVNLLLSYNLISGSFLALDCLADQVALVLLGVYVWLEVDKLLN